MPLKEDTVRGHLILTNCLAVVILLTLFRRRGWM
jgi:hypothetical protein